MRAAESAMGFLLNQAALVTALSQEIVMWWVLVWITNPPLEKAIIGFLFH